MNSITEHQLAADRDHPAVLICVFILIAYFPIFLKLDVLPLRVWDEARTAISAYEMFTTGNLLVVHYEGLPDMRGVKPPLSIWAQTFLFHLIGPGELAVRLPSAIAALLTGWFLFWFCWRDLQRPWLGLMACAVLFTSFGMINMHGARSGDHDAPMVLFMTLSLWSIHRWCDRGRSSHMFLFFCFLALGGLTQSVQALLFLPGIAAYVIARRKLRALFRERWTYLGLLMFLVLVGAYYLGRESVNPGYLQAVWDNELWGRYAGVVEEHDRPWDHYFNLLMDRDLTHYYMWIPAGFVLGLLQHDARLRNWTRLLTFTFLGYLLVVSTSATKLDWYTAPMMPLLAGIAAIAMYTLLVFLMNTPALTRILRTTRAIPYLFFFLLFVGPWSSVVAYNYKAKEWPWEAEFMTLSHLLKDASRGLVPFNASVIVYDDHYAHLLFYVHLLNAQGHDVRITRHPEELHPGDVVITNQYHIHEALERMYTLEFFWGDGNVRVHKILGPPEIASDTIYIPLSDQAYPNNAH